MIHSNGTIEITEPTSINPTVNSVVFTDSEGMRCVISLETLLRLTEVHKADMIKRNIDYKDLVYRTIENCLQRLKKDICKGE